MIEMHAVPPVRIERRLIDRIGIREWGLPTLVTPGQIWRSTANRSISCMLAIGNKHSIKIETRRLEVIEDGELSEMPNTWRAAMWSYVKEWPSSGCEYGPFLAITREERCGFLRTLATRLIESNDIGCLHIAHDIGLFAAVEFELNTVEG